MKMQQNLEIQCHRLASFDARDWSAVKQAFAGASPCKLTQMWREIPEAEFQPAQARAGWRDDALWVYAELSDCDIFNDAAHFNDRTYELGDLFEILIRPDGQEDYFEFHITPENQQLQLHWPDADAIWKFDERHESLQPYFVPKVLLVSQTEVQHQNNFWRVLAKIPSCVARSKSIKVGDVWVFSFSRYDCTRGKSDPALSSCSPHAQPRFHRQQEWGRLHFLNS
jgi:hypothetical protein